MGSDERRLHRHNVPAARRLRTTQTLSEALLWKRLRNGSLHGAKFRRQHPIHQFVLDFYCAEVRLAVEIDGRAHADPEQQRTDRLRQQDLEAEGIRFLRIAAWDVERQFDRVVARIAAEVARLRQGG